MVLKRAILEQGLSLNIIFLPVVDAEDMSRENITRQMIEVSGFGSNCTYILGFVNLDLTVGQIRAMHRFHVIDSQMAYHLLLG